MLAGWNYYVTGTRWVDVRCYALRHLAMHPEIPRPILSEHCLEEVIRHPGGTHDPKRVRPTGWGVDNAGSEGGKRVTRLNLVVCQALAARKCAHSGWPTRVSMPRFHFAEIEARHRESLGQWFRGSYFLNFSRFVVQRDTYHLTSPPF